MLFIFVATSCKNATNQDDYKDIAIVTNDKSEHPGKQLLETNCYVCHSPILGEEGRIAPPMIAIKKHYISEDTTKDEFIESIQNWIKNPNEDDAKMYGAVRRFGVMPNTPFPEDTIEKIADYMFENEIDQPEWFDDHFNSRGGRNMKR